MRHTAYQTSASLVYSEGKLSDRLTRKMSAVSITEAVIAGLIVAGVVAVGGLWWQRRQVSAVEDLEKQQRSTFDERAYRVLEAMYDLANGNPGLYVDANKAAERADIPHTIRDFDPLALHLRDNGLIQEPGTVGLGLFKITPAGIREVERNRAV